MECLSVQTYLFKISEGELATMICLSLLQALVQNRGRERERGEKKNWGLSSCVYSEQMQHVKGGIYYVPKEKHSPDDENMIGRPG